MSPTYSVCQTHGYINGEVYKCPICDKETEVYSRITGYYRPVKNWNDGKAEEYKNRKVYDLSKSHLKHEKCESDDCKCDDCKCDNCECNDNLKDGLYLFTRKNCPNCKSAKSILDKANLKYEIIDAEENADLSKKLGIKQAPTLLAINGENIDKYSNVSNIKKYIGSNK